MALDVSSLSPDEAPEGTCKGVVFLAHKTAVEKLWGPDAFEVIAKRLPEASYVALAETALFASSRIPERHMVDWHNATFNYLGRDEERFASYTMARMQLGFGTVARVFLKLMVGYERAASKVPELWRRDHDKGDATCTKLPGGNAYLTLTNSILLTDAASRLSLVHMYRAAISIWRDLPVRVGKVGDNPAKFEVWLNWDDDKA